MVKSLDYVKEMRSKVMYEVAKLAWNENLETEIEKLPEKIRAGMKISVEQIPLIEQEINLAMGLSADEKQQSRWTEKLEKAYAEQGQKQPIISHIPGLCQNCSDEGQGACATACHANAIEKGLDGRVKIDEKKCDSCGLCITTCPSSALADKVQFLPLIKLLQSKKQPVYAEVAPAIAGQFGKEIKIGQLRSALKAIGFIDMVEVALFADILSIKEAYEFDHFVKKEKDFMLTSCCCPVWINMIEKKFPELMNRISPSVSPMIAGGRVIKVLHPEAKVVFIGPCIAKKNEAIHPELEGAVDFVLTFKELDTIFAAVGLELKKMPDDFDHQSSWGGRAYGRTGGVSASISLILETIAPQRSIKVNSKRVDGAKECQEILKKATKGEIDVNFIEGMGCKGGCIGGPGRLVDDLFEATDRINEYAYEAKMKIPLNNPEVYGVLKNLGINHKTPKVIAVNPLAKLLTRELSQE